MRSREYLTPLAGEAQTPSGQSIEVGCLYSPSCREEVFSETGLPVYGILGNSEGYEDIRRGVGQVQKQLASCLVPTLPLTKHALRCHKVRRGSGSVHPWLPTR